MAFSFALSLSLVLSTRAAVTETRPRFGVNSRPVSHLIVIDSRSLDPPRSLCLPPGFVDRKLQRQSARRNSLILRLRAASALSPREAVASGGIRNKIRASTFISAKLVYRR